MKTPPKRPATEIAVRHFRLLFQWPLVLDHGTRFICQTDIENQVHADCTALYRAGWKACDPVKFDEIDRSAPSSRPKDDAPAGDYQEFVYFHDFTQNFLYPNRPPERPPTKADLCKRSFLLYRNETYTRLEARIAGRDYGFEIDRLTLHMFPFGIAMMTLELAWPEPGSPSGARTPRPWDLSLADVQTVIDHLRRSDIPFWQDKDGKQLPQRVPDHVRLFTQTGSEECPLYPQEKAIEFFGKGERRSMMVLEHWRKLIEPLSLAADGGPWRDPSDERIAVSSYISLTPPKVIDKAEDKEDTKSEDKKAKERLPLTACREELAQETARAAHAVECLSVAPADELPDEKAMRKHDLALAQAKLKRLHGIAASQGVSDTRALLSVAPGDWARLAEADMAGTDPSPYNAAFLNPLQAHQFYDRFLPDGQSTNTTRHVFGGAHYAAVGAGWFFDNIVWQHWRRHYAQLSMIVRFENAALLALSSRLSQTVKARFECNDETAAAEDFNTRILDVQQQFLNFVHRFRFTGVTSQIQGTEMHDRWRHSLDQDALFEDVKAEIETASATVLAHKQTREAEAATLLSRVALFGVVGGLIVGALGMNILVGTGGAEPYLVRNDFGEWQQSAVVSGMALLVVAFLMSRIKGPKSAFEKNFTLFGGALGTIVLLAGLQGW